MRSKNYLFVGSQTNAKSAAMESALTVVTPDVTMGPTLEGEMPTS
jgi:hypothetical protein